MHFTALSNATNPKKTSYIFLGLVAFDSAVKSGNFILLDKELRNDISELYVLMDVANYHANLQTKMTFDIITDKKELAKYRRIVDIQTAGFIDKHNDIITKIELLLKKLKQNLK